MVVMAPKDENELCRMLKTALDHNGPIAFRYPRGAATGTKLEPEPLPVALGKGEVLEKGEDVLILAIGSSVSEALCAHADLLKEGIHPTLVNCRFVKPLDAGLIRSLVMQIPRVITVEEHVLQGGFGSSVLELLIDSGLTDFHLERLGIPDTFVEHGSQKQLRSKYRIDAPAIVEAAKRMMSLNP